MFILSRKPKKNRRIQWGISKVENQRTTGGYKGVIESRKPKNRWIQRGNRKSKIKEEPTNGQKSKQRSSKHYIEN
jgi:hypothetical protein